MGEFADAFVGGSGDVEGGYLYPSLQVAAHMLRGVACAGGAREESGIAPGAVARAQDVVPAARFAWDPSWTAAERAALGELADALGEAATVDWSIHRARTDNALAVRLVGRVVKRVRSLRVGEAALFPGGWQSYGSGHAIMYMVERDGEDRYRMTVINTGSGLAYHELKVSKASDVL